MNRNELHSFYSKIPLHILNFQLSLRFTCEVVSDCVLGIKADTFTPNAPSPILDNTKQLFEQTFVFVVYGLIVGLLPWIKKYKKMRFFPKHIEKFFLDLMQTSFSMRKQQMEKGMNKDRVDFMNYMLQLQEKKNLQIRDLTLHTMTFLLDGFETSAGGLSHCLLFVSDFENRTNNCAKIKILGFFFSWVVIPNVSRYCVLRFSRNQANQMILKL